MRTRVKVAIVAGLVFGVLGSTSFASAAGGDNDTEVLRLTAKTVQEAELDLGDEGFSLGDKFVFTDDLFRGGKKVGRTGGECTATRIEGKSADFQCLVTLRLPKGQVTVQGLITFTEGVDPEPFRVAITGGTGAYRDAGGFLVVDDSVDPTRITLFIDHLGD